ncbi:MAG: hypothetical protein QF918_07130 [Pirellulaceae bacterium]|jgi:hypothetical protein|nr:hypothetical protein [Pirellulaceae bacterium]MDP6553311.1 hypothetical protein [Pirellulaceae bacterium]
MTDVDTIDVLNRLAVLHHRSLAVYVSYAQPEWKRGEERARQTLELIAADEQMTVDRLSEMISDAGGNVHYGAFPMEYTGYHDLSFDFLLGRLIENQQDKILQIQESLELLSLAPTAKSAVEEALGAAKGHLQSLQELQQPNLTIG